MSNKKRKGTSVFQDGQPAPEMVILGDPSAQLKERLQAIRRSQQESSPTSTMMDPLLDVFQKMVMDHDADDALEELALESKRMQTRLEDQLHQVQSACQAESDSLAELEQQVDDLKEQKQSLLKDIETLDQEQVDLHHAIALHQKEASEEMEQMDEVEEARKRQVPRLKMQLSLYASTTGIKWDFSQDGILSGSVSVPDQAGMKLFSIDPRDHSSVGTANRLWSLMEGKTL